MKWIRSQSFISYVRDIDVRDILILEIYWAMRPKPSVGPLLVIEANLILGRLGLSSIYTLIGSHCNKSSKLSKSRIIVKM